MSAVDELARRVRILESQQQFLGAGNSVEDPFVNALARSHSFVMGLPALRAYWTLGILDSAGDVVDSSGAGVTLTRTAAVVQNANTVRRGMYFNGTTAYLRRADGADVDYTGTNAAVISTQRGLTISAWVRPQTLSAQQSIVSKWVGGGNLSYILQFPSGAPARPIAQISVDGTNTTNMQWGSDLSVTTYYHVLLRFVPSTSLDLFVDGVSVSNTTSIPASIYNGTAQLNIGARASGTADFYNGYISDTFVCDTPLRDDTIEYYYNLTAPMYKQ